MVDTSDTDSLPSLKQSIGDEFVQDLTRGMSSLGLDLQLEQDEQELVQQNLKLAQVP